ncbi:hypothetical protein YASMINEVIRUS_425 [Yasminevirus sp. GU-2018]|uniref:Uncharacterized protein n=1 Tax=Yasminevirus sp. GU-2018 TaxID=2420051 RepID=A0A5K0U972_9VIRU|nr:hypothetical protein YASMINEVIRUS_425 [Yasminevirus sp. GU-2018]
MTRASKKNMVDKSSDRLDTGSDPTSDVNSDSNSDIENTLNTKSEKPANDINDDDDAVDDNVERVIEQVIDEIANNPDSSHSNNHTQDDDEFSDVDDDDNDDDDNEINDMDSDVSDNENVVDIDDAIDNAINDTDDEDTSEEDEHSRETTQKVDSICETEYCNEIDGVGGVSLKTLCDAEGVGVFDRLKKYVEDNDPATIRKEMQRLMTNLANSDMHSTTSDSSVNGKNDHTDQKDCRLVNDNHVFENLLILKTYKRLKTMENACLEYKNEYETYSMYIEEYQKKRDYAKVVREANLKAYNGISVDNPRGSTIESCDEILKQILTPHKINREMMTYELLFYKSDVQTSFTEDKLTEVAEMIQQILNRFNPIVQSRLEDHSWTINYKDTLNFKVKKGRVIFSNTIRTEDEGDMTITSHLNMLRSYLRRVFRVKSICYKIIEDNKFYLSWIFFEVGFYPKKQVGTKTSK